MKNLDIQEHVINRLEIKNCEWDWSRGLSYAEFISESGDFRRVQIPANFTLLPLTIAYLKETECIIGIHRTGNCVWALSTRTGAIEKATELDARTELDPGLMYSRFEVIDDKLFFFYEGGLIAFDSNGSIIWQHRYEELAWEIKILYENHSIEIESPLGHKWQYSCVDGLRMDAPRD